MARAKMMYCRSRHCRFMAERSRLEPGGDLYSDKLVNGRWTACPNCGRRMFTTKKPRRKQ